MKNIIRLFIVVCLTIVMVSVAQPALANHHWFITGVSCDPKTDTITISGYLSDESSVESEVFVNGVSMGWSEGPEVDEEENFPVYLSYVVTDIAVPDLVEGDVIMVRNFPDNPNSQEEDDEILVSASAGCGEVACVNLDNRLNSVCADPEQSAAVYCRSGNIVVYAVNEGKGYFAFNVTQKQLAEFPAKPETNILIKQNLGARLYKLTTGEYQVNRVKPDGTEYSFIFDGC